MSFRRYLLRRAAFSVLAVYAVVSLTFAVVVFTPDTNLLAQLGMAAWGGANETQLQRMRETYLAARNRDRPLLDRYVGWLVDVTLLQWGVSHSQQAPVARVVLRAAARTSLYVVPGMTVAVLVGVSLGFRAGWDRDSRMGQAGRVLAYALFGVPTFLLGALGVMLVTEGRVAGVDGSGLLVRWVLPPLVLAAGLLAGQVSFSRSQAAAHVGANFVTFLRAKGMDEGEVRWRVLRNAAVPLSSLVVTELLAVLFLNVVVVEFVFGIDGIGRLLYVAAQENDIPLLLGTTMVLVCVGVGGSFVQDVAAGWLDPRVRAGD